MSIALEVDGVAFDAECDQVLFNGLSPFDRLPKREEGVVHADGVNVFCGVMLDASGGRLAFLVGHDGGCSMRVLSVSVIELDSQKHTH